MKIPLIFRRRRMKAKVRTVKVRFIGSSTVNSMLKDAERFDKEQILEIGDINKDDRLTVDFSEGADFVGDFRAFFTNDYELTDSIRPLQALQGSFAVVRMQHVLEHIQWPYQSACLAWVHGLLMEGGMLYIETPNLEFIAKVYLRNLENIERGQEVRFPVNEYPGMVKDCDNREFNETNSWKWINFKLYSGCSLNDYHHCCYDAYWLARAMNAAGFGQISICSRDTLRVIAYKSSSINNDSVDKHLEEMFA